MVLSCWDEEEGGAAINHPSKAIEVIADVKEWFCVAGGGVHCSALARRTAGLPGRRTAGQTAGPADCLPLR